MSDIIQPSDRFGEAHFIETWEERRLRRERERDGRRLDLPRHAKGQSKKYNDEFRRRFCRLYGEGMKYDRIAIELNIGRSTVAKMRTFYKLPRRTDKQAKPFGKDNRIGITIHVTEEMDREITAFLKARNRTRASWLRSLIRNNLDAR